MRLRILSDLHVESAPFEPPPADADVVVLAGDVHNGEAALHWARAAFPDRPIVQVAGNHEFYDGAYDEVLARMRAAARELGIHFLENDAAVIGGVRFLGCTLWTDYRLFEDGARGQRLSQQAAMEANRRLFADYFAIAVDGPQGRRRFEPADSVRLHEASRAWLAERLGERFDGPTVVVTHHLPSWRSVHPQFARWVTNAGFASDVDALVGRAGLWIHGHTHTTQSYAIGTARVACNPRGYPRLPASALGVDDAQARPGGRAARHEAQPPPGPAAAAGAPPRDPVFENPAFDPALVLDAERG
ncbi:MAG: metallophosphoesterase [Solirubrobacteraceae bacterium]|nr:metallophosphoesterase [Solirubrobacteraceae bacterium]